MKRISILVCITLIFMAVEMVTAFTAGWNNVDSIDPLRGKIENLKPGGAGLLIFQKLNVVSDSVATGVVRNTNFNVNTPYAVSQIAVSGWMPKGAIAIVVLCLLGGPFMIWGMVNFVKLLLSVFKQQIFTKKNARRLRIFVYATYGSLTLISLYDWFAYNCVVQQVEISGYVIKDYFFLIGWSDMLLMCLFAEIFAFGVKLQEEQELTI